MIGNVIQSKFLETEQYPTAAAMSVALMAVIVVLVAGYVVTTGTEDLL
jgi:spermidine/putrescine transport system permease protein